MDIEVVSVNSTNCSSRGCVAHDAKVRGVESRLTTVLSMALLTFVVPILPNESFIRLVTFCGKIAVSVCFDCDTRDTLVLLLLLTLSIAEDPVAANVMLLSVNATEVAWK